MVLRIVAALLLVVAIGLAWPAVRHLRERPPSPTPPVRLSLAAPPGSELGSGDEALDAAISPDDRSMVFVATTDGTPRLWRRAVDADRAESLSGTDGAQLPAWKPAGNVVAFFSERRLKQIAVADGVVRDLADASAPAGATWLPDGSLLFSPESRGPIRHLQRGMVMNATTLRTGDRAHVFPIAAAADGAFVYTAVRDDGSRVARLVEPKGEHELITTGGHAQLVGDLLLFIRDNVLLAQRYDPVTGVLVGRATSLASGVGVSASGRGLFAASARLLLSATFAPRARALTWLSLEGSPPTTIGEPADYWQARLSPDDRYVALTVTAPLIRTLDIRVVPTTGGAIVEPLTLALAADSDPVWSPDGRRIVFRSLQKGQPDLFVHTAHQTEATDAGRDTDRLERRTCTVSGARSEKRLRSLDVHAGDRRAAGAGEKRLQRNRWSLVARWPMDCLRLGRIGAAGRLRRDLGRQVEGPRLACGRVAPTVAPRRRRDPVPARHTHHARRHRPVIESRRRLRVAIPGGALSHRCAWRARLRRRPSARRHRGAAAGATARADAGHRPGRLEIASITTVERRL